MNIDLSDLIGKPFDENGYGPDSYSCYGLLFEVYKRLGIDLPITNISVCACKEVSEKEIKTHVSKYWIPTDKNTIPSAILIRSSNPEFANHIATNIGNGKMIHITRNRNVVIDHIVNWKNKIIGYYSYANNSY